VQHFVEQYFKLNLPPQNAAPLEKDTLPWPVAVLMPIFPGMMLSKKMMRKGQVRGVGKGDIPGQITFVARLFGVAA